MSTSLSSVPPIVPATARLTGPGILRLAAIVAASVVVLWLLFFDGLADRDLWSSHEARAAQNAQSILDSGDWGMPRLYDGRAETQKPPLYYWLVAVFAKLADRPVDAWAVRLPAALSAVTLIVLVGGFLWLHGRRRCAFFAAVLLATMIHFTWLGRVGRIDMPLALTVTMAIGCLVLAAGGCGSATISATSRRWRIAWAIPAYLALSAAVLLKGPIGLVLPTVAVTAWLFSNASRSCPNRVPWQRRLADMGLWWGLPLVAVITVPWFLYANGRTDGQFLSEFLWKHNLHRGLGGDATLEAHPIWFYLVRLWPDWFPWSLLLPFAVVSLIKSRAWRDDDCLRFGLATLLPMALFLSLMRFKRADYLLPAYPAAAIVLACVLDRWSSVSAAWRRSVVAATIVTVLTTAAGWYGYVRWYLPRLEPSRQHHTFASAIRRYAPRPQIVLLFRIEAHALVHHLGRPIDRIVEWENLDIWACQPMPVYVVMRPIDAADWPRHLEAGRLYPVVSNWRLAGGRHEKPLWLLCTQPVFEAPAVTEPAAIAANSRPAGERIRSGHGAGAARPARTR